jgi:hypothetical protein
MSTERTEAQVAPMTNKPSSRWRAFVVIGGMVVWCVFLGVSSWPIRAMSRYGHGWAPTLTMATAFFVVPALKWRSDPKGMITGVRRVLFYIYLAIYFFLGPISFLIHPVISSFLLILTIRWGQKKDSQQDATVPAVAERR